MRIITLLFAITIFSIIALSVSANGKKPEPQTTKLKTINKKISSLKKKLTTVKSKRDDLNHKLKESEINIGTIAKAINKTQLQLLSKEKLLKNTKAKEAGYRLELNNQKNLLAKQIRAAYMLGRQPYLKILLNRENPEETSRYLRYYQYLSAARLKIIERIKQTAKKIDITAQIIQKETLNLIQIKRKQEKQKETLRHEQSQRQYLLKSFNLDIKNKNRQLEKLYTNKKYLENIIRRLNQQKAYGYYPGKKFDSMRGKLHWPIAKGRIIQYFNQILLHSQLHSTGILIDTPAGKKVHAVFPGKVVFADWLRGFGLLVILQHGQNYMTLYGRNQSLYVKVGQTVQAGQVIATTGNSGGFQKTALYFEIRRNAIPIDPQIWFNAG